MANFKTHYDNLQVSPKASEVVVRAAYKSLAQKYHPDKFDSSPSEAERVMKIINEAYAVLTDPTKRMEHDAWIRQMEKTKTEPQQQYSQQADSNSGAWQSKKAEENKKQAETKQNSAPQSGDREPEQQRQPHGQQQNSSTPHEFTYEQATKRQPNKSGILLNLGKIIGYLIGRFAGILMNLFLIPLMKFIKAILPFLFIFGIIAAIATPIVKHFDHQPENSQPPLRSGNAVTQVQAQAQVQSSFLSKNLPQNLSIELPNNWIVATQNTRMTMEAWSESLGVKNQADLQFYAECYGQNNQRIANINVLYTPNIPLLSQAELSSLTQAEVENAGNGLQVQLTQAMEKAGGRLLSWDQPKRVEINGVLLVEFGYSRIVPDSGEGVFNVKTLQMFSGTKSFKLTIGYSANHAQLLEPIVNHIIGSIKQR